MAKKQEEELQKLEKQKQKALRLLESSYLMYENTKKEMAEAVKKKKDKDGNPIYSEDEMERNLELVNTSQKDVIDQYLQAGGKIEDLENLKKSKKKIVDRKVFENIMKQESAKDEMAEYIAQMRAKDVQEDNSVVPEVSVNEEITSEPVVDVRPVETAEPAVDEKPIVGKKPEKLVINEPQTSTFNPAQGKKMYDMVNLPSKGQCYKHKKKTLKVAYLTAFDENMILSPNLYKDGNFIDYLLRAKVLEDDIDVQELTQGDRDAIILWLRATGYGNAYPIAVTDPNTGNEFETTVDLNTLNYRPFNLKGDVNGYFDFTVPSTGDKIKFKFLNTRDLKFLDQMKLDEDKRMKVAHIKSVCDDLIANTGSSDLVPASVQQKIKSTVEELRTELGKNYDEKTDYSFSHELTDRLRLQTVSVNGISDRNFVDNFIYNMNVRDAAEYRRYLLTNEPGIDFNIEVERPASLGGGSIKSFLQFNQFVFINI